ncbi:MAG: phosphoglyceromutase [Chitinophagaceae bacterium]|nr:phosphoglyceromutase [Chitinophagaceae bacterium]
MRILFILFLSIECLHVFSQKTENIIIVTTDGLRWQDVFRGMDSAIANNPKFNQEDSGYIFKEYWADNENDRRKKLMPFLWTKIVSSGQVYGNRRLGNKVDNANPYWFSYPGYSEIMTGFVDTSINSNAHPPNPNTTVLEFLNKRPSLKGRVAAFGAWNAFDRILNEQRSGIPVISAFDSIGGKRPSANEKLINALRKESYKPWLDAECLDVFTHFGAMEWLKTKKPKVLYIAYGETDEWAHSGMYRSYLDATRQVDAWLKQLWSYIQSDPQYRNKTTLFITVDHGRGDLVKEEWTSHNNKIVGANEIWFAVMGPSLPAKGEVNTTGLIFQQQFAQTLAKILGFTFKADHPIAPEVSSVFK